VQPPLLQAFPFPSTLGEVTLQLFSPASMFIYSSHGKWAFPLFCEVSLPPPLLQALLLLVAGRCHPSCLLWWLVYLQFCEWLPLPPFSAQGTPPSLLHVLFVVVAYFSVFSFFPVWGSVCLGGYADLAQGCLWEFHVPLSSPCGLCLPQQSGRWYLVVQDPSWFLCLT
jgi:hypothetical protein